MMDEHKNEELETHLTLPDNWFRHHGLFGAFEMISKWVRQGLFSAYREGMDLRYREIDLVLTLRMRPRSDGETEWPENLVSEEQARDSAERVTWINRKLKERSAE